MWRKLRLRRRSDFLRLRHAGKTTQHAWMLVSVIPNDLKHNRYGFITSKTLGKAVVRNRVRRVMREAIRHYHPQLCQGFDVVFIARQKIVGKPYQEVFRHIGKLTEQAGLKKKDDPSL